MAEENVMAVSPSPFSLDVNNFQIKIAETEEEILAALRLRFEVFNIEMNEGLASSWDTGLDQDKYDVHADHLIVIDKQTQAIVGTYRLIRKSRVISNGGFYSEGEFNLDRLKKLPDEILELGRSCVHKDYRSNGVINLLWLGIAKYVEVTDSRYLIGCGSLHTHNVNEISEIYSYLKVNYFSDDRFRVYPVEKCMVNGLRDNVTVDDSRSLMKKMPPLLKGYFRAGAVICGEPALDSEFGTTDFLILLTTENITKRYSQHYRTA